MARLITVEPILFGTMMYIVLYNIVSKEYIYHFLAKSHGLNVTVDGDCGGSGRNKTALENKVSAEASQWGFYLNIAGLIPSLLATLFTGSWGDSVGRRPPMILSCFGFLVLIIDFILVFHYELPLYFLLFGRIFSGLCGDFPGMLASTFAYLSDISTQEQRTVKVAIGEFSISFGSLAGSMISGVWVDAQGYVIPLFLPAALMASFIIYCAFILPESLVVEKISIFTKFRRLLSLGPIIGVRDLLRQDKQRSLNLSVVMFCFFLQICIYSGIFSVLPIIQLSPPLCFSNTLVGYITACYTGGFVVGIFVLRLLKTKLSEIWIVCIAVLSNVSSMLVLAFATTVWMNFLGVALSFLQPMASVVFRSSISQLVKVDEQGSAFSLLACVETMSSLVASFIYNGIYAVTVSKFSSAVMFVAIGMSLSMGVGFRLIYNRLNMAKENTKFDYSSLENSTEAEAA